ncbi:hypothetical protein [Ruegeria lacuscaerulensis]|uniref:hypothetical protein n=1 Tax=Ruegeria lacuscaerulensis TaxID=55218 RepID=UPI00147F0806|nr:hypothetical protein [Ruegeria lacuscaerulensis]
MQSNGQIGYHSVHEACAHLRKLDFLVKRSQLSSRASPFLGLALDDDKLPDARAALHELSDWKLSRLLSDYSYACSWAICATLSEHYGEDGNAKVWPHIENLLAKKISIQDDRISIFQTFVRTCRKLGLAAEGFEKRVHAFQIHAGVSRTQLRHLARAFIAQERSLGLPDQNDIVQLNRWEDDALHFLAAGVEVLQRPILMDHSAWMAAAYVEWRRDQNSLARSSSYLRQYGETLRAEFESSAGAVKRVVAAPRLAWEDGRPQLAIPGQSRRYRLLVDGVLHRVRAGRLWPLPYPLPNEVSWEGENAGKIDIFQGSEFVIFDSNTGRQVSATTKVIDGSRRLSGVVATAIVVSREAFQVNGIPAREVGLNVFCADVDLRAGSVELTRDQNVWVLTGARRPQISIHGLPIAKGLSGANLWGPNTEVELDFGSSELLPGHTDDRPRPAFIQVDTCGNSSEIEVEVDGRGIAKVEISELAHAVGLEDATGPVSMVLTLLRSHEASAETTPTRFKRKLAVWPGFLAQDGLVLVSDTAPDNFVEKESKHVSRDDSGFLCLDRGGGFSEARIAFSFEGQVSLFTVRPAVLFAVFEHVDGTKKPWVLGDAIVKGAATKSDAIVVNSPDRKASLRLGARLITDAFRDQPTFAIPIATLDGGDIVHVSSEGLPTLVATVESALQPTTTHVRTWEGGTRISVTMPFAVGGVMVRLETENGQFDQSEVSFDHLPTESRSQYWLSNHQSDGKQITFDVNGQALSGFNMITLRLRQNGQQEWFQLSNARNDRYAFPLVGGIPSEDTSSQIEQLDRWLSKCYAPEVWDYGLGQALQSRWNTLVRETSEKPGGKSKLLLLAVNDDEPDWLPMLHVVQEIPTLFAEPAISFHAFSASSGSDRILRLLADAEHMQLRALNLNPMALLCFPNARTAAKAGETLKNFKPSYLPAIFSTLAEKPGEWLGVDALGPDHASTAVNLLRDRIEANEILGAGEVHGRMSLRSVNVNRVASSLRDPALEDRCVSSIDDEDASVHMIEQALLAFAFASRSGPDAVSRILHSASTRLGEKEKTVLASIGEMIRLGRELFSFHLIATELELRSKS